MKIRELQTALGQIEHMLNDMNAKSAAADFRKLSEIFEGFEDVTVATFVAKTKKGLAANTARPSSKKSQPLREELIDRYLQELTITEQSSDDFFKTLEKIGKDRKVRIVEAIAITQRRLSTTVTFRTKKAAIEKIKKRYVTDSHDKANKSLLEKMWGT